MLAPAHLTSLAKDDLPTDVYISVPGQTLVLVSYRLVQANSLKSQISYFHTASSVCQANTWTLCFNSIYCLLFLYDTWFS